MKTMYVAYDGTQFETAEACLDYEKQSAGVRMFAINGEITTDVEYAFLVYIPYDSSDEDSDIVRGAKWFIDQCMVAQKAGCDTATYDGIDEYSSGWFIWDECHDKYHWLDSDAVRILLKNFTEEDVDNT